MMAINDYKEIVDLPDMSSLPESWPESGDDELWLLVLFSSADEDPPPPHPILPTPPLTPPTPPPPPPKRVSSSSIRWATLTACTLSVSSVAVCKSCSLEVMTEEAVTGCCCWGNGGGMDVRCCCCCCWWFWWLWRWLARLLLPVVSTPVISVTGYEVVRFRRSVGSLEGSFTSLLGCCCCSLTDSGNDAEEVGRGGGGGGDPLVDMLIVRTLSNRWLPFLSGVNRTKVKMFYKNVQNVYHKIVTHLEFENLLTFLRFSGRKYST